MYTSLTYFQRLMYFFIFLVAVETYPDCSTQDGDSFMYFSHEEDCNSFWQCSNGQPYLFKCPSTLHFNSELNVCDFPQNVGCITSSEDSSDTTTTENIFILTTEQPSTTRPTTTTQQISTTKSANLFPMCITQLSTRTHPTYITQKITTPSDTDEISSTTIEDTTPSSTTIEVNSSYTTVPNNYSLITSEASTEAETVTEHVTRDIISTISDVTEAQTKADDSTDYKITDVDPSATTNTQDETFKISSTSLTTASTENMDYLCEPSSEYFFTAHPKSCTLFIACSFGTAHVLSCYGNKWFNSITSNCVEPANSNCNRSRLLPIYIDTETESYLTPLDDLNFICDNEITGTFKYHPSDCEKFFVCVHGHPVVINCPEGLHLDLTLKKCVYSYESECSLKI